jgi:hypothetical protein
MTDLHKLRSKLCRELAQSEHDAKLHTMREARRLGTVPPAVALRAIATHAEEQRPRFESLMRRQPAGLQLGRAVGFVFSTLRHYMFDRLLDTERSYRATLLGLKHGLDVARLLREVAARDGDAALVRFCDDLLVERALLVEDAEQQLAWFAECPQKALLSGFRMALSSSK